MSEGRRYAGLEHWMPLFYDGLDTLFDYLPGVPMLLDPQVEEAAGERLALVQDYFQARETALKHPQAGVAPYKPLPPRSLYLTSNELKERLATGTVARMTPFAQPESQERAVIDCGAKPGRNFAPERAEVSDVPHRNLRDLFNRGDETVVSAMQR